MIADSPLIGKIILILVLIAIDAFCSCAEIAVISLDASELEKMAEEKNKKAETCNTSKKNKDYVLKEAEMVISNYISNIENPNTNKSDKLKANRKYIRLKNYAYISSVIMFIQ